MELKYGLPKNLLGWAEENKDRLAPPVCNAAIFPDGNYIINMVGGPNIRSDFHDNPGEEIFYQIKGEAYLLILDRGQYERVNLKEGDIFLMPAHLQHSPQRPKPGLCYLIEQPRPAGHEDVLNWYCAHCASLVWRASKQLESLVADLPVIYQAFYALPESERTCPNCGTIHPGQKASLWHEDLNRNEQYLAAARAAQAAR